MSVPVRTGPVCFGSERVMACDPVCGGGVLGARYGGGGDSVLVCNLGRLFVGG